MHLQKIIAWFLIGLLFFEATFRVPFVLPDASALESADHEDVVSLLVEEELFRKMPTDIDTYARRIQAQLPHTRTVILTFARDAHPYLIASANERLYFSGLPNHGKKTQKLVGTILIGHVPLPVVHRGGLDFLSMYPYTDFSEPHFFWNWETSRYEFVGQKQGDARPDIWHSVIDPNTGNMDTDIARIRDFFTRVYEFDAKKSRYRNVGDDPQVLYMDSVNESRAASKGLLSVYEQIFVPQQEHLLYHRTTREFAQYLYTGFLSLMKSEGSGRLSSFSDWNPGPDSASSFLDKASDITTKIFGDELITPFIKVINEKYLGDLGRWVHNSGRYYNGYSEVRVDTIPELITTKDALAGQVIKESNDALEKLIDRYVESNLSLDIPILVSRPGQKTIQERYTSGGRTRLVSRTYDFIYDNYIYGTKASDITSASQCSLIRGSTFGGRNTTVETNHGYSVLGAKDDAQRISTDGQAGIKCLAPTDSYWGGNSPMNVSYANGEMTLKKNRYDDFSAPILDLAAGKKTTGTNSPLDCLRNDLLLHPYQHNGLENRKYLWPVETKGERYSCATPLQSPTPLPFSLDPTPETQENILTSLVSCAGTGNITLLDRSGASLGLCQTNGLSGTYKRIPSLVKHSDPTTEIYGKQLQGSSTPNLPVDEERHLLYLDRTGASSRIDYPNLFDIVIDSQDTDAMILKKIQTALAGAQSRLVPAAPLSQDHKWSKLVPAPATPAVNLSEALLADPDIRAGLVDALRWRHLDIEMKYAEVFETALSAPSAQDRLILADRKDLYEIAYLGGQGDARNFVFGFSPEEKSDLPEWFTGIQSAHGAVSTTLGTYDADNNPEYSLSTDEIDRLLGSNASSSVDEESDSDECGDPSGVVIWEWLWAIQCWLKDLLKTEWFTPDIDDIGFPELPSLTVSVGNISWSTKELKRIDQADSNGNHVTDYLEAGNPAIVLDTTLSASTIEPSQTLRIDSTLEEGDYRLNDDTTRIQLVVTRIDDLDDKKSYSSRDADWSEIQNRYFSVSGSSTLKDGHAVWIFTSRNDHRARITFESRIYAWSNILLHSQKDTVLIGPIVLGVTVLGSSEVSASQTVTAGDPLGITILLSGLDAYPSTADVAIHDYVTGQEVGAYRSVPIKAWKMHLGSPAIDPIIRRTGKYTMTLVAGELSGKTTFTVVPGKPHHIGLALAPLLIKDMPEKMTLTLQDALGNTINAQDWKMTLESSSNVMLAPLSKKPARLHAGAYQHMLDLTPLEAGNTTFTVTLSKNDEKITTTFSRPILSDAHLVMDIPNRHALEVWQEIPVTFTMQRQDGSLIENWDIELPVAIRSGDAKLSHDILTFSGGRATTTLKTGTRTGTASVYLRDTGLGKIVGESFTILPGAPTSITLTSPEVIHAKAGAQGLVTAHIYDRYGNLTTLHDHVLVITADKPALLEPLGQPREVHTGVYETRITSRGAPGRVLFRGWLEKSGKKSTIATLENVSMTNALPVITSEEAASNAWQNITQVLLGGAFGQTPVQGYFWGSALFAPATKTLAVSTLIDTPETPLFTLMPSGNIVPGSMQFGTGVKVKVESYADGVLTLLVYDTRLGSIARVRYPLFSRDQSLSPCTTGSCDRDMLSFTPGSPQVSYQDGIVSSNSQRLFSLSEVFASPNLTFAFIHHTGEELRFSVAHNGSTLGMLSLRWKGRVPSVSSSDIPTSSTYVLESLRSGLATKLAWGSTSSHEIPSLVVYSPGSSTAYPGWAHAEGWSAYPKDYGLGWTDDNTSLLQFASGQEWSASIRDHADYLTINLGDPVIALPKYQVDAVTGLDRTLWEPVYIGGEDIDDFTFRDANSDGKRDLIAYHPDGTVWMTMSRGDGSMIDIGDLLSVRAAKSGMVRAGDFLGDGYADIVYVDEDGSLHYTTHDADGPIEKPLKYDQAPALGRIDQLEVFDMDHDGRDDIVLMDHQGSLYVFYGHPSGVFGVQLIDNVYDFVLRDEAKSSYFTGAIRYRGPGFVDPASMPKAATFELQSKQDQVNGMIFTPVYLPKKPSSSTTVAPATLGTTAINSLDTDTNGFLRMYDGDAAALRRSLQFGYDELEQQSGDAISVRSGDADYEVLQLLKAPFVNPAYLTITKQYTTLEQSGQVLSGSPVEVRITVKNTSQRAMSDIMILETFADYLSVPQMRYDLLRGTSKETRDFVTGANQSDAGIADLRGITLSPGATLTLIYTGTLRSFSFGRFDVGYLEDSHDPTSDRIVPNEKIRTKNPSAASLAGIPEKEFHDHDVYGDIRFNPNETCGGPLLLWRSHNTYDRTYHKTVIVRDVEDPDQNATRLSQDPTDVFSERGTPLSTSDTLSRSQSELADWQSDSDGDAIPNRNDDDHGDVFEVNTSGNTTQISIGLGKIDAVVESITNGVNTILSGMSCWFGDSGCISMPINWSLNAPGNTVALLGYAAPWVNQPPYACHKSVLCGVPAFSYPTDCCSSSLASDLAVCEAGGWSNVYQCMWPSAPKWAGGALDYPYKSSSSTAQTGSGLNDSPGASGSSVGLSAPTYETGLGISQYRLWITPTLTGAIAVVMCFGQNDSKLMNLPGFFPLRFDGNCIFAMQPLLQNKDDGSDGDPLAIELDMADSIGDGIDNRFTNADSCGFFEPIETYPSDLSRKAAAYLDTASDASTSDLLASLSEHANLVNGSTSSDAALAFSTDSPHASFESLDAMEGIDYEPGSGGTWSGMIQISLDPSAMKFRDFGKVLDINLKSIKGFPNFVMDWYQRQMDEIMSSLTHLPDLKITLPDLSGLADSGWISSFGEGVKDQFGNILDAPASTASPGASTWTSWAAPQTSPAAAVNTAAPGPSSGGQQPASSGNFLQNTTQTIQTGWNQAFNTVWSGLNTLGSGLDTALSGIETARDTVVGGVQQKTAGIQNAFEYLGTLPIVDVHPETISFDIPWAGKQEAQAWLVRNEAMLQAWKDLPQDTVNSVGVGAMISSIESNIETVRSYLELPEQLQNLFYLKEKLLYGILQNVHAVQDLMGWWLYDNGQRFRWWTEAFVLVTKLFDLWQVLIDVFSDYEVECGECSNERWNLQHWMWIVISAIIPPIPIIQMPRWPDIGMDFSDMDLSLDVAYPVFDLSFYPVSLPDAPAPTISGFDLSPMPQLPPLPNLNVDLDVPVIQLPQLPDLPPPPKIPELSQAISVVLDIFKILTLIQCLYRKIPLTPEWYAGTKIAHKTERQGYLPFDFLDVRLPSVTAKWLEAIDVSTHVKLDYDVSSIVDMLDDTLQPFTDFPRNLGNIDSGIPASVDFDISPESGVQVQTSSADTSSSEEDIARIPEMIGRLFTVISQVEEVDPMTALDRLTQTVQTLDISPERKSQLGAILETGSAAADFSDIRERTDTRFGQVVQALNADIEENGAVIQDLIAWSQSTKKPEDIPLIAYRIPGSTHLAQGGSSWVSNLLSLPTDVINPAPQPVQNLVPASLPLAVAPAPETVQAPSTGNAFEERLDDQKLTRTRGLYVTNGTTSHRLIDYTDKLDGENRIHTVDDDRDGDLDVYYSIENVIYRKENHTKSPARYIIKDAPKVYSTADIYEKFFGIETADLRSLPRDGQIGILQSHTSGRVRYQMLSRAGTEHMRLRLSRSLFETEPGSSRYQTDIIPEQAINREVHTFQNVPSIQDIDGLAFIEHKQVYRTLTTGGEFIDEEGKVQTLSLDFVIRKGQSGYTAESTTLDITTSGKTTEHKMARGQRVIFAADSKVRVKKWSLILFGNTTEKRALTIRDTHMPLLPGDFIITDKNGGVTLSFPDGTETEIGPSQYWSLTEYAPGVGIKKLSLPVETQWYYGTITDARSTQETRLPHGTVFDAYTDISLGDAVSQIPRQITLALPGPTEIDFQTYFPADTLTHVEILRLPGSQWRRVSSTKIAFESQKEGQDILVRITASGRVRDYTTRLVSVPPKLFIEKVDDTGALTGKIAPADNALSLGIQSYLDGQSWSIAGNFASKTDGTFATSIPRTSTKFSLQQWPVPLATFDRSSGVPTLSPAMKLVPDIRLGKPLWYSLHDSKGERLLVSYQGANVRYRQVATQEEITGSGVFVLGTGLRLEPATTSDTVLKGGVYITDASYRPLLTLDASGVIRTLDPNISWSVKTENGHIVFTLTRDRVALGTIILQGDMITTWWSAR